MELAGVQTGRQQNNKNIQEIKLGVSGERALSRTGCH
jgi:hypothetical protein